MVPMARIERATSPLPRECSTTEPHGHRHGLGHWRGACIQTAVDICRVLLPVLLLSCWLIPSTGAGDGNRTRILSLEGCCTTIVLYPPDALAGRPYSCTLPGGGLARLRRSGFGAAAAARCASDGWWGK